MTAPPPVTVPRGRPGWPGRLWLSTYAAQRPPSVAREAIRAASLHSLVSGEISVTQTLDGARPKIVAIADDTLWSSANAAACKAPSKASDCDGINVYIGRFPSGAHADEARTIRDGSTRKIDALGKKEETQARLDEQRQAQQEKAEQQKDAARQKQEQLEDCKRNCKENMCAAYVLSDRFGLCMSRCVQNMCQ